MSPSRRFGLFSVCILFVVCLFIININAMDELSPISFQNALVTTDNANSNIGGGCACKASVQQMLRANNNNNGGFTSSWNQMNDMLKQPVGEVDFASLLEVACDGVCKQMKNFLAKSIPGECQDFVDNIAGLIDKFDFAEVKTVAENVKKCLDGIAGGNSDSSGKASADTSESESTEETKKTGTAGATKEATELIDKIIKIANDCNGIAVVVKKFLSDEANKDPPTDDTLFIDKIKNTIEEAQSVLNNLNKCIESIKPVQALKQLNEKLETVSKVVTKCEPIVTIISDITNADIDFDKLFNSADTTSNCLSAVPTSASGPLKKVKKLKPYLVAINTLLTGCKDIAKTIGSLFSGDENIDFKSLFESGDKITNCANGIPNDDGENKLFKKLKTVKTALTNVGNAAVKCQGIAAIVFNLFSGNEDINFPKLFGSGTEIKTCADGIPTGDGESKLLKKLETVKTTLTKVGTVAEKCKAIAEIVFNLFEDTAGKKEDGDGAKKDDEDGLLQKLINFVEKIGTTKDAATECIKAFTTPNTDDPETSTAANSKTDKLEQFKTQLEDLERIIEKCEKPFESIKEIFTMDNLNIKTLLEQIQTSLIDTKGCVGEIGNSKNEKLKEKMSKIVIFLKRITVVVDKCKDIATLFSNDNAQTSIVSTIVKSSKTITKCVRSITFKKLIPLQAILTRVDQVIQDCTKIMTKVESLFGSTGQSPTKVGQRFIQIYAHEHVSKDNIFSDIKQTITDIETCSTAIRQTSKDDSTAGVNTFFKKMNDAVEKVNDVFKACKDIFNIFNGGQPESTSFLQLQNEIAVEEKALVLSTSRRQQQNIHNGNIITTIFSPMAAKAIKKCNKALPEKWGKLKQNIDAVADIVQKCNTDERFDDFEFKAEGFQESVKTVVSYVKVCSGAIKSNIDKITILPEKLTGTIKTLSKPIEDISKSIEKCQTMIGKDTLDAVAIVKKAVPCLKGVLDITNKLIKKEDLPKPLKNIIEALKKIGSIMNQLKGTSIAACASVYGGSVDAVEKFKEISDTDLDQGLDLSIVKIIDQSKDAMRVTEELLKNAETCFDALKKKLPKDKANKIIDKAIKKYKESPRLKNIRDKVKKFVEKLTMLAKKFSGILKKIPIVKTLANIAEVYNVFKTSSVKYFKDKECPCEDHLRKELPGCKSGAEAEDEESHKKIKVPVLETNEECVARQVNTFIKSRTTGLLDELLDIGFKFICTAAVTAASAGSGAAVAFVTCEAGAVMVNNWYAAYMSEKPGNEKMTKILSLTRQFLAHTVGKVFTKDVVDNSLKAQRQRMWDSKRKHEYGACLCAPKDGNSDQEPEQETNNNAYNYISNPDLFGCPALYKVDATSEADVETLKDYMIEAGQDADKGCRILTDVDSLLTNKEDYNGEQMEKSKVEDLRKKYKKISEILDKYECRQNCVEENYLELEKKSTKSQTHEKQVENDKKRVATQNDIAKLRTELFDGPWGCKSKENTYICGYDLSDQGCNKNCRYYGEINKKLAQLTKEEPDPHKEGELERTCGPSANGPCTKAFSEATPDEVKNSKSSYRCDIKNRLYNIKSCEKAQRSIKSPVGSCVKLCYWMNKNYNKRTTIKEKARKEKEAEAAEEKRNRVEQAKKLREDYCDNSENQAEIKEIEGSFFTSASKEDCEELVQKIITRKKELKKAQEKEQRLTLEQVEANNRKWCIRDDDSVRIEQPGCKKYADENGKALPAPPATRRST